VVPSPRRGDAVPPLETGATRIQREVGLAAFGAQLEGLDPWVVDRMTSILVEQGIRAGQVLWAEGEPVESLYFMFDGRAEARREGAPPWTFEGKWFLGAFEGFDGSPARRSLVALTDFDALKFRRSTWFDLLEDSFELTRIAIGAAASSVARLDERRAGRLDAPPRLELPSSDEPLRSVERLAFLTEVPLARGAGVQALADLAAASDELRLRDGDTLFRDGEERDSLYVVVNGCIEARRASPDVVRTYVAGDVVGGASAFSERGRAWTAHARGPARLLAIPVEAWFDLAEEHFDLVLSTLGVFARARESLMEKLADEAGPEGLVLL
jgi:CRP-like cAMP-binding protein